MNTYCPVCGDPVGAGAHRCRVKARPGHPVATIPLGAAPGRMATVVVYKKPASPPKGAD